VLDHVCALLAAAGTPGSVLPPTLLYNEGWMLRLVLDWFAARPRDPADPHPLAFLPGACWYTEALLHSPFLPRFRGDPLAEAFTHADAAVGHFKIGTAREVAGGGPEAPRAQESRGDLAADADSRQLVIVEAKMWSPLAGGTKNAPGYGQAARNVACLVEAARGRVVGLGGRPGGGPDGAPHEAPRLGFVVVAPRARMDDGFRAAASRDTIARAVAERVGRYQRPDRRDADEKARWLAEVFLPTWPAVRVSLLAWEDVLTHVVERDAPAGAALDAFYRQCLAYNRPSAGPQADGG
jgi:hypothetical protein